MIHCLGDSHSWCFKFIPGCKIHHVGSVMMFRVGRDGWHEPGIEPNDTVIWAFGEIDVRCHVVRIADRDGRTIEDVANALADAYVASVLKATGRHVIACVTPPSNMGDCPPLPMYGTLEQRTQATLLLNARLKWNCEQHGIPWLDFYWKYANPDGSLDMAKSDGIVHLVDGSAIREAFDQLWPHSL